MNISSLAAVRWTGYPYSAYYAAKAGVNQFTVGLALQYAAQGIRANAIMPGLMNTPLIHQQIAGQYAGPDEMVRARDAACPMGRMGTGWDVAHAAVFLASDEAGLHHGRVPAGRWRDQLPGGVMEGFKGKAPGSGSGEMSRRTQLLRPAIALTAKQSAQARRMRRAGAEPGAIAEAMQLPLEEIEKALVQMRSPRPETTRGTLNVTLAAHRLIMQERRGDEPIWQTVDRMLDELLRLRTVAAPRRRHKPVTQDDLPLLDPI